MSTHHYQPGLLLRTARESASIPAKEAARRTGVSYAYYRRIENGGHFQDGAWIDINPSDAVLRSAARAVGANPADVLKAAGYDLTYFPDRGELHTLVDRLPERLVEPVAGLLRELATPD